MNKYLSMYEHLHATFTHLAFPCEAINFTLVCVYWADNISFDRLKKLTPPVTECSQSSPVFF